MNQRAFVLVAFIFVWTILNVPTQQATLRYEVADGVVVHSGGRANYRRAGFPWRFVQIADQPVNDISGWSFENLIWDVGIGLCITALLAFILRRTAKSDSRARDLQVSLGGLIVAITVFAAMFAYYRYGQKRFEADLQAFTHEGGECSAELIAPFWLTNSVDMSFIMEPFVGVVDRQHCSDDDFTRITGMKSLESITISNEQSGDVCSLAKLPQLDSLYFNCELDDAILQALDANKSLCYFTIPAEASKTQFQAILDLIRDEQRVQHCSLSMQIGMQESVRIADVPRLAHITVWGIPHMSGQISDKPFVDGTSLAIENVPNLQGLYLHRKVASLRIRNAPQVKTLEFSMYSGPRDELELSNLPQLKRIQFGDRIPQLRMNNLPALPASADSDLHLRGKPSDGITMQGTLTLSDVQCLGEWAKCFVLPSKLTAGGLAQVLPRIQPHRLDFRNVDIRHDMETAFDVETIVREFGTLDRLESLFMLSLGSGSVPVSLYNLLEMTPNLKTLIAGPAFTDQEVALLDHLPKLEVLNLTFSQISQEASNRITDAGTIAEFQSNTAITLPPPLLPPTIRR